MCPVYLIIPVYAEHFAQVPAEDILLNTENKPTEETVAVLNTGRPFFCPTGQLS